MTINELDNLMIESQQELEELFVDKYENNEICECGMQCAFDALQAMRKIVVDVIKESTEI